MTRKHSRRGKTGRKPRPVAPPIRDPGTVRALDSEDQAGTYAPLHSAADTGENDEGVFAQGPLPDRPSRTSRAKQRIGGAPMRPKKKRVGHDQPDAVKDEGVDTIGGTDGEGLGDDEDWGRTVAEDAGYGRPQEQDADDELI